MYNLSLLPKALSVVQQRNITHKISDGNHMPPTEILGHFQGWQIGPGLHFILGVSKKCIYSLRARKTNNGFIAF
jgi:hypothetical protein